MHTYRGKNQGIGRLELVDVIQYLVVQGEKPFVSCNQCSSVRRGESRGRRKQGRGGHGGEDSEAHDVR